LNYEHQISASKYGDFMVDNQFTFEIGGHSKVLKHIKGVRFIFILYCRNITHSGIKMLKENGAVKINQKEHVNINYQ
jgi:hypothetical protein